MPHRSFVTAALLVSLSACTSPSTVTPSPVTPSPGQVFGAWVGEQTVTSVRDGDCLGPALQDIAGFPSQFRGAFAQSGTAVTASLDIDHTGATCDFVGSLAGSALSLGLSSCHGGPAAGLHCPTGERRDLVVRVERLDGLVNGDTITGTATEIDAVLDSDTRAQVGVLTLSATFTMRRSGSD